MATPLRVDQITAADWQPKLDALGDVVQGVEDVQQCIRIILMTPQGSVPHRPTFGSGLWEYLDQPLASARPHLVRETVDALARWEPRLEVTRVEVGEEESQVLLRITGRLRSGREISQEVALG